ncbi:M16 family metallopeptidase [Robiginitalea sp. IMCC43444]|uniref:M16 family metallopeptidase n=1 Tax=Robiginitalea sp. IMCC43444 TaxID=3459121 RepID=UPI0040429427
MKKILFTLVLTFGALSLHAQVDRTKIPEAGPAPKIKLDKPEQFKLGNGLTVLVVENHKLPRVSVQLDIDNPPIYEGDKAGVASLTGSMLGKGSKNISMDAFNEEIDFMGARLEIFSQGAFGSSLSKYFPRLMELMAEAALSPNFTQEEFDKEKNKLITNLKSNEKDTKVIARRVRSALAYGVNHPYGEFTTEETVNNVTLVDVQNFYRNYFVPANAYLVVVGDTNLEEVKKLVEEYFLPWTKASPPSFEFSDPSDAQYTQINFVDVPNAVQSEIWVENLVGLQKKDPDYLSATMANFVLGSGGFTGRLMKNLRQDKGYTYSTYSSLGNSKWGTSTFAASAGVRNMVTDSAVVEILKEIERMTEEPISEKDLELAKAMYSGNFVMQLERPSTIANYAVEILQEDLPENFYETFLERIEAITVEDIQKASKKYFKPNNARVVVAGKGSELLENLEKVSFKGKTVPVKYYTKYAQPAEKPDYSASVPEGITVAAVVDKYFMAIGGKDKVGAINSLKLVYEGSAMGATIKTEEIRTAENYAQTTFMNNNPMMGVIAKGDELFMKQGGNKMPLPPQMQKDMKNAMGIFPEQGFASNPEVKLAGTEMVEGKAAYRIDVPGEVVQASYFYDVETGLKVKEASVVSMNGQTQNQETFIKEYQEVDGVKFPSVKLGSMGPQPIESKLLEAIINYEVTESDFN